MAQVESNLPSGRGSGNGNGNGSDAAPTLEALPAVAGWAAGIALVLYALQQSLRLPSGFGVEDWLGWSSRESLRTVTEAWCDERYSWPAAAAYLLIDQGLFVPLYAALALLLSMRLRRAMREGSTWAGWWTRALLGPGMVLLVTVLVVVDSMENFGGAGSLGLPRWIFGMALLGGAVLAVALALWAWPMAGRWRAQLPRWCWLGGLLCGLALALGLFWQRMAGCAPGLLGALDSPAPLAFAHGLKLALIGSVVAAGAIGWLVWWFGAEFDRDRQAQQRNDRAAFRGLAAAVVGRSRYVLAVLAVFAALTLVLDQCRDVLLGLVHVDTANPPQMVWRMVMLAVGALAAGLLAHSCWLWARLVGMVERPGLMLPKDTALRQAVGHFAQAWARTLAVLPLAMVCVLVATTLGDLVMATRHAADGGSAVVSACLLVAFALLMLVIAGCLVHVRRRLHLPTLAAYYNSEAEVHALLWYGSRHFEKSRAARQGATGLMARLMNRLTAALVLATRPWALPVVALLGMALVRACVTLAPQTMAATPATLLVLMLALTWWLGVLGAMSLFEQRDAFPWIVLPLGAAGVLSALGWSDNHALPWPLAAADGVVGAAAGAAGAAASLPIDTLRGDGRTAMLALVLAGLIAWWACMAEPKRWPWPRFSRWLVAVGGLCLAQGILVRLDRQVAPEQAQQQACKPAQRDKEGCPALQKGEPLDTALSQWLSERARLEAGPVFLVAAEGGGIRSAYWTAVVLAHMHALHPDFERRTLLLSGVSGGSMGHAAYLACVRLLRHQGQMPQGNAPTPSPGAHVANALAQCIDASFARLDALTPLLGGLLFEDVFSRVLPLARGDAFWRCTHPGCAHVNRAEAFEREWIAAFADGNHQPLAQGLQQPPRPGEPLLALNSTWVETGNRTVAFSVALAEDALPGAAQLMRCMGADMRLVSAAHTSARFPITNPLAGVRAHGRADDACASGGHLIDGGYFDNSAVPTLMDVQRAWMRLAEKWKDRGLKPTYLLIRNGQSTPACALARKEGPGADCIHPPPGRRTDPTTLDGPSDRGRLTLYADVLGPALGLLNVSGIGSRPRNSAAALRAAVGETGKTCADSSVWLMDQLDDGELVPLGWYLSSAARAALLEQARLRVPGTCG